MKFKETVVLTAAAAVSFGCASHGSLFADAAPSVQISASDFELILEDGRSGVGESRLRVPAISFPGQKSEYVPPLGDDLERLAREVIERSIVEGRRSLSFRVTVQEGSEGFQANAFSEEESVSWRVEVEVRDKDRDGIRSVSQGASWGMRSSLDASPERIAKMSRAAFEQALLKALSGLDL